MHVFEPAKTHPPLGDAELSAIRARADRATPGPWLTSAGNRIERALIAGPQRIVWARRGGADVVYVPADGAEGGDADAAFVAHARRDVPRLLAEVDRLRAALASLAAAAKPAA